MTSQKLLNRITNRAAVLDGEPTIRGRPLSVEAVIEQLANGETYETLSAQYDWLEPEDIQACLLYAQRLVKYAPPEPSWDDWLAAVPKILEQAPYIQLIVLFGSRARGDARYDSDWDFAFLCDEAQRKQYESNGFGFLRVWSILQETFRLRGDQIDAIEMKSCSDLLAHYIAKDGIVLYEDSSKRFEKFRAEKLKTPEALSEDNKRMREDLRQSLQALKQPLKP